MENKKKNKQQGKNRTQPAMHPRNIYNTRHNFNELAKEYPEFKANTTLDVSGRVHLDFKNPEALRALSRTLLKKDFNLDVKIPINAMIPTIPLRLNYILFIEDLLNSANITDNIKGLDIGTGASCVYPLMIARKNEWRMVGTDINSDSIECATQNVIVNKLDNLIDVVQVDQQSGIDEILKKDETKYDFCMCNPPFFGDTNELCSQIKRKPDRAQPRNAFTAASHEVVTEGGEVEFVGKIIEESCNFQDRIRIFTSMLGIKRSLDPLIGKLKQIPEIKSTTVTDFYQGHTTRFGIAWTFEDDIDLKKVSNYTWRGKKQKTKPFVYSVQFSGKIETVDLKLKEIFNELQITYKILENQTASIIYNIIAYSDTWTHNRQKRRKHLHHINKDQLPETANAEVIQTETNFNAEIKGDTVTETTSTNITSNTQINDDTSLKRKLEDSQTVERKRLKTDSEKQQQKFLEGTVCVQIADSELAAQLDFVGGSGSRNDLHGVFQYIKNHLKFD